MPQMLIFRQYDETGKPLVNGYVVEREVNSQEEFDSAIAELKKLDYELESSYHVGDC
jgi:hypothetical protein